MSVFLAMNKLILLLVLHPYQAALHPRIYQFLITILFLSFFSMIDGSRFGPTLLEINYALSNPQSIRGPILITKIVAGKLPSPDYGLVILVLPIHISCPALLLTSALIAKLRFQSVTFSFPALI